MNGVFFVIASAWPLYFDNVLLSENVASFCFLKTLQKTSVLFLPFLCLYAVIGQSPVSHVSNPSSAVIITLDPFGWAVPLSS